MSGKLAEGMKIVGSMTAERSDGSLAAVVFLTFEGEDEDSAQAFELVKDGHNQIRLEPCNLGKLSDWRKVITALSGGEGG